MITSPLSKRAYAKTAQIYKLLANSTRLEIMNIIKDREVTVSELSKAIGVRKANASQHLAILRYLGLVTVHRKGKYSYYRLIRQKIPIPLVSL